MKQSLYFPLLLLAVVLSSCTTYQFSARQTDVRQRSIDSKEQMASIVVNYDREVTATSDYQLTRKDAIAEAEFLCIQDAKIDVVVDPIYKIEYNPFKLKKRFKATIIGYAGTYKEEPNRLDDSKNYTLEEIEKFKLLYDSNFPKYYYQKSNTGDSYYFNGGGLPSLKDGIKSSGSIMLKNAQLQRPFKPFDAIEMERARNLRNSGISMLVCGAAVCLGAGLPMLLVSRDEILEITGCVLMGVGGAAFVAGIPMVTVGAIRYNRMRKEQSMQFTLNAGSNGIGLGLTF